METAGDVRGETLNGGLDTQLSRFPRQVGRSTPRSLGQTQRSGWAAIAGWVASNPFSKRSSWILPSWVAFARAIKSLQTYLPSFQSLYIPRVLFGLGHQTACDPKDCHDWLKRHRRSFLSSKILAMLEESSTDSVAAAIIN